MVRRRGTVGFSKNPEYVDIGCPEGTSRGHNSQSQSHLHQGGSLEMEDSRTDVGWATVLGLLYYSGTMRHLRGLQWRINQSTDLYPAYRLG